MRTIEIAGRAIGPGAPCYLIAEAGVNHNGRLDLGLRLVDAAARSGADAVKFQTFAAERVTTRDAPKAIYQKETTGKEESQLEMLRKLELCDKAHREIQAYCRRQGIVFLSTPFDEQSADFLDELHVPAFKIPSGEITNLPFLEHVARKGMPLIVSTGMSSLDEVASAVAVIRQSGNPELALLHCVSAYPAAAADANLRAMQTMAAAFDVPIGFSDHTAGIDVALAAVALGACIVEKHFTLDRDLPGPDHRASLEPDELRALVQGTRTVEAALGHGRKEPAPCESDVAVAARKSLVVARALASGTVLAPEMIVRRRPGKGLAPAALRSVIGRRLRRDVLAGHVLRLEDLD